MKAFKITLILIFSLLACQLLAADKGSNTTTTQKPVIIDITVVYLPDFPLERTILLNLCVKIKIRKRCFQQKFKIFDLDS